MFSILFVCTANRIRSPVAAACMREAVAGFPVIVESAGILRAESTRDVPETALAAQHLGLDLSDHRPRSIDSVDASSYDLVIGFEIDHVARAVVDGRARAGSAYLLGQLDRLLARVSLPGGEATIERARATIAELDHIRASERSYEPGDVIGDPLGKPPKVVIRCAEQIRAACGRIASSLFASR